MIFSATRLGNIRKPVVPNLLATKRPEAEEVVQGPGFNPVFFFVSPPVEYTYGKEPQETARLKSLEILIAI